MAEEKKKPGPVDYANLVLNLSQNAHLAGINRSLENQQRLLKEQSRREAAQARQNADRLEAERIHRASQEDLLHELFEFTTALRKANGFHTNPRLFCYAIFRLKLTFDINAFRPKNFDAIEAKERAQIALDAWKIALSQAESMATKHGIDAEIYSLLKFGEYGGREEIWAAIRAIKDRLTLTAKVEAAQSEVTRLQDQLHSAEKRLAQIDKDIPALQPPKQPEWKRRALKWAFPSLVSCVIAIVVGISFEFFPALVLVFVFGTGTVVLAMLAAPTQQFLTEQARVQTSNENREQRLKSLRHDVWVADRQFRKAVDAHSIVKQTLTEHDALIAKFAAGEATEERANELTARAEEIGRRESNLRLGTGIIWEGIGHRKPTQFDIYSFC